MAVHVNGIYVVGEESNEKGNIIKIYKHEYGYYYYYTIKGNYGDDFFEEDSPFEKSLVYYGFDYCPVKLKGNEEEDNMDEKIVVLRNDKAVTATKYINGKMVNSATAKCHPDDKFDFNVGAKIAVDRLIRENNNTDRKALDKTLGEAKEEVKQKIDKLKGKIYFDLANNFWNNFTSDFWDGFKKGKIQVRVTSKNIGNFLQVAKNEGIEWRNGKTFNPFCYPSPYFGNFNVVYLVYEYKYDSTNNGLKYDIFSKKDMMVVDWDEILPLLPKKTVYSNDFNWNKFLNGEIVVEMKSKDFFMFSFVLCSYEAYIILCDNTGKDKVHFGGYSNFVRNNNVELDDLIWCKVKDNKIIFSKAHTRNFGLVPNNCVYKYDGK